MTGIADLYLYLKKPHVKDRRKRLLAHFLSAKRSRNDPTRFVVLSWKRTGSNLLCGMLHLHPEITMHNELFNPIDIFTYHPKFKKLWTVLTRDLFPHKFLEHVYSGKNEDGSLIKPNYKAVGFKSFPEHWIDVQNEGFWKENILEDLRVKKVVLSRDDELAVFVSMKRADSTGLYMTHTYPQDMKITIDIPEFQCFLNNYRNTFRKKYRSPIEKRDTFKITYEQLVDESFEKELLPKLLVFLGVDSTINIRKLKETVKQADPSEDLSKVIANYDELEFCFHNSDLIHFQRKKEKEKNSTIRSISNPKAPADDVSVVESKEQSMSTWSLLIPICSRPRASQAQKPHNVDKLRMQFNSNRFIDLALSSQHNPEARVDRDSCWSMLQDFATSLHRTTSKDQLEATECIVGIDVDDSVFQNDDARSRIRKLFEPSQVDFVDIKPTMYGQLCKIWNALGQKAKNDFVVLFGDDVRLLDSGWQERIAQKFHEISTTRGLPLGAAVVAMKDLAFPGFPTFPVVHRWHLQQFGGNVLPKQFSNQGGDPYLYELYSRFDAASFDVTSRLENTIGGDGDSRYVKHHINWRGQILSMNLRKLKATLGESKARGVVLDVVVPSYRTHNNDFLRRILLLRATRHMYVKFWLVVDNPSAEHVLSVKQLAAEVNETHSLNQDNCNYFVNVIHYGENRGASYARNTGFNYTTADWVLFLDDDVIPDPNLLDAYMGATMRYPEAKVFVGLTELPASCNPWTEMLCACNVGYFYAIAKRMVRPSWGVTANLMVRGSRFNSTIQFKTVYPKTGGGEDIDFVYQFKQWYGGSLGRAVTASVPEAKVKHPWWNRSGVCYKQVMGWAWGDSLCITEWPAKTFITFPNWVECVVFLLPLLGLYTGRVQCAVTSGVSVIVLEHVLKAIHYFADAHKVTNGGFCKNAWVALGAGSVLSSQEITRTVALIHRASLFSMCRRVDWFDGEEPQIKLNIQLSSFFRFVMNGALTWVIFHFLWK